MLNSANFTEYSPPLLRALAVLQPAETVAVVAALKAEMPEVLAIFQSYNYDCWTPLLNVSVSTCRFRFSAHILGPH